MSILVFATMGGVGGFLSGLLGVGGAVVLIPLLLTVPAMAGLDPLSMHLVSGLSMVQVFFASSSGFIAHYKERRVNSRLLLSLGVSFSVAALGGAWCSRFVEGEVMLIVFGVIVVLALAMLLLPLPERKAGGAAALPDPNHVLAAILGLGVGSFTGMVGAGGGFLLVPLMVFVLRVPMQVAVGTSLGVVLIGSVFGAAGKVATGQVDWSLAIPLSASSVVFALLGAKVNGKTPPGTIRIVLFVVVLAACAKVWWRIVSGA